MVQAVHAGDATHSRGQSRYTQLQAPSGALNNTVAAHSRGGPQILASTLKYNLLPQIGMDRLSRYHVGGYQSVDIQGHTENALTQTTTHKIKSISAHMTKPYHVPTLPHPRALNTAKALITVRGAAKSCRSDPNLKYSLTLPRTLKISDKLGIKVNSLLSEVCLSEVLHVNAVDILQPYLLIVWPWPNIV